MPTFWRRTRVVVIGLVLVFEAGCSSGGGPSGPTPTRIPDGGTIPAAGGRPVRVTADSAGHATYGGGSLTVATSRVDGSPAGGAQVQATRNSDGSTLLVAVDLAGQLKSGFDLLPAGETSAEIALRAVTTGDALVTYAPAIAATIDATLVGEMTWGEVAAALEAADLSGPVLLLVSARSAAPVVDGTTPVAFFRTAIPNTYLLNVGPAPETAGRALAEIQVFIVFSAVMEAVGVLTYAATMEALLDIMASSQGYFLKVENSSVSSSNAIYQLQGADGPEVRGLKNDVIRATLYRSDQPLRAAWREATRGWLQADDLGIAVSGDSANVTLKRVTSGEPEKLIVTARGYEGRFPVRIWQRLSDVPNKLIVTIDGEDVGQGQGLGWLVFESGDTTAQHLTVSNGGPGALSFEARPQYDWLALALDGQRISATVQWDRLSAPGTYNNIIRITSNGGNVNINVTARKAGAEITVN